jgi:serine/threonine protein kinase
VTTLAGRYAVIRQLGSGSFGQTFLARDQQADRDVAVKVFNSQAASDWKAQQLFEREAAVLRALRHHGVPEIFEYLRTEQDGTTVALLVMEYIDGESVSQLIDTQTLLDTEGVMHLLLELLSVLEYLHTRVPPILHRDIKPSNIIVRRDGTPVLVDFGSVRRVFLREDESGSTIAGTYGYMPYEQYMGQATPSSDLYALGATMLHLITGRAPREFIGDAGAIEVPHLPGDARISAAIARMLQPSPANRFASAREARHALIGSAVRATSGDNVAVARAQPARRMAGRPLTTSLDLSAHRPRQIRGELRALLDAATPSFYSLSKGSREIRRPTLFDRVTVVFLGVATVGILPLLFYAHAQSVRRRFAHFLAHGLEAEGEIRAMETETTSFGTKLSKVSYDFTVAGEVYRNADRVDAAIGERWAPGDRIRVLYIPEENFDSVVVSM